MGMFDRFDNKNEFEIPNNIHPNFCDGELIDSIIVGGSVRHIIYLPYPIEGFVNDIQINYYNKLNVILTKSINEVEVNSREDNSTIIINLTPEETSMFEKNWDSYYQAKITLITGEIVFTDKCFLKIIKPLEENN